jgi:uncharacterized protein
MNCPKCSVALNQEIYEGTEIDKCPKCKGVWLDSGELTKIIDVKEETFKPSLIQETLETAHSGVPQDEQRRVVRCPKCNSAMRANNYDFQSGIIIDTCQNGHGVWLDRNELEKVQAHREHWAEEAEQHKDEWIALAKSSLEGRKDIAGENRRRNMRPTKYLVNSLLRKILGG